MNGLLKYSIDIINLKNQEYRYEFNIDPSFFALFEESEIDKGSLYCLIILRKTDGFIEVNYNIEGIIELECDRSLDKFDYPISLNKKMIFKFGEADMEIDDEVEMINQHRQSLDMSQYIYEFIAMGIPMKKLHPRYDIEDQAENDELFYTSTAHQESGEDKTKETDPRWEALKKLKEN